MAAAPKADYDVFISYAHVEGANVDPIERALTEAGLRVFRDTTDIAPSSSITRAVEAALASSKSLLAYYSRRYPRHRACQWELTAAFLGARRARYTRRSRSPPASVRGEPGAGLWPHRSPRAQGRLVTSVLGWLACGAR